MAKWLIIVLILLLPVSVLAQVKAFPSAEGYGANSIGGRGGTVFPVTHLGDSGPGSLRECVEATIPRTCVFRVSGTILLTTDAIKTSSPYLTIAGQTSPGGIQIKGPDSGANQNESGIWINNGSGHPHDIIIRYIRVRSGVVNLDSNQSKGILFYGQDYTQNQIYNVIVDHSSFQWQGDTQLDAIGNVTDVTFQWNILSNASNEGVNQAIGSPLTNIRISVLRNLYALSQQRNPSAYATDPMDFRNNIIYGWNGNNASEFGTWHNWYDSGHAYIGNIINNIWYTSPYGSIPFAMFGLSGPNRIGDGTAADRGGSKIYTEGNWAPGGCESGACDIWTTSQPYHFLGTWDWCYYNASPLGPGANCDVSLRPVNQNVRAFSEFSVPPVTTYPTDELQSRLFAAGGVGASRNAQGLFRDSVDTAVINDVNNGTGFMCIQDFCSGPWPSLSGPTAPTDSDNDGIPDSYETNVLNSDPNLTSDGAQCPTGTLPNCYTRLEIYLNELAGDTTPSAPGNANPIYVSQTGGTPTTDCIVAENPATPIRTVLGGCACMTFANKEMRITQGTYDEVLDSTTCPITGGSGGGNYTTITAFGAGSVVLRQPVATGLTNLMMTNPASNWTKFKDITFNARDNAQSVGIHLEGVSNILLDNVDVIDTGFEAVFLTNTSTIEFRNGSRMAGANGRGFYFGGLGNTGFTCRNCTIENNGTVGIDFAADNGTQNTMSVIDSIIRNNGGVGVRLDLGSNAVFTNVLVHNNSAGVHVLSGAVSPTFNHLTLANNTTVGFQCDSGATTVQLRNSISFGNATALTNNCTASTPNLLTATPSFVNAAGGDFHLQLGSVAINAGAAIGVTTDLDGNTRVGNPDLGAYEFITPVIPAPTNLRLTAQ